MEGLNQEEEEERIIFDSEIFRIVLFSVILAWISLLIWQASQWTNPDDIRLPFLVGGVLVLLLILQIVDDLWYDPIPLLIAQIRTRVGIDKEGDKQESQKEELKERMNQAINSYQSDRSAKEKEKYELLLLGWIIALPFLLHLFGFTFIVPLYLFTFLLFFKDLNTAIIITIIFNITLYIFFIEILGIIFWQGIIELPWIF